MNGTGFRKTELPNGVRVLTEKVPGVRSISIGVWVDQGSRDEPEELSGISHFIEHMIFKGTKKRSALDIAKAFDRMGGISNAFTSKETICFHAKVMDTHEDEILELLSDIFLNSRFSQEEIERERLVVLQEISMVEDTPEELIHDLFYQFFWPDHGLGRPVLGSPEIVSQFVSSDISSFVRGRFSPDRVVLACAGNVDHDQFVKKVDYFFGKMEGSTTWPPRTAPVARSGVKVIDKDLEQVNVLIGFEGPSQRDDLRFDALLLNVILGGSMSSRLFQEIRERRGLAYSVYSFHSGYSDSGLLGMYAGTGPDRAVQVVGLMLDELRKLADNPVSDVELQEAKDHVKGGIVLASESTDARMNRIARLELVLGRYASIDEVIERIDRVTPESVMKLAQTCLGSKWATLIMGKVPSGCEDEIRRKFER